MSKVKAKQFFCVSTVFEGGWYKYKLSISAQAVLFCLVTHSKRSGIVSQPLQELATTMGINRHTFGKSIRELQSHGLISIGDRGAYIIDGVIGEKLA